jgi:hypothetical protein
LQKYKMFLKCATKIEIIYHFSLNPLLFEPFFKDYESLFVKGRL